MTPARRKVWQERGASWFAGALIVPYGAFLLAIGGWAAVVAASVLCVVLAVGTTFWLAWDEAKERRG